MNHDNTTSHISSRYDAEVENTIPYYAAMHEETLRFVKAYNARPRAWLDTGCGTGNLALGITERFAPDELVLADPSADMLDIARAKLGGANIRYVQAETRALEAPDEHFDVVTAIQSHHYYSAPERAGATARCFRLLKKGGLYITFENTRPSSEAGTAIVKEYWKRFQVERGKTAEQAADHLARFDTKFFPITVDEHLALYRDTGFAVVDCFWRSYIQAGFYCVR